MSTKNKFNILEYLKKRNVKRFSLFFLIAFVFLIISKLSNDYKQTIKLKVDLVDTDDEIMLKNDSLNTMEAYIEAKGFALLPLVFKDYRTIKLSANTDVLIRPNHYVFDVEKYKFLIEEQLGAYKILSLKPDTLFLQYSKRAAKYVSVDLKANLEFSPGFDVFGDYQLSKDSVKIVGAVEQLSKINSVSTKEINLQDIKTDIEKNISLEVPKEIEAFPKAIDVKIKVKRFTEGTIEVPVTIKNKPLDIDINYFPKSVTVLYYVDLEHYNAIEASDFIVECDYLSSKDKQSYFIPKIVKKPEFVKRVNMKQKRIDFIKL